MKDIIVEILKLLNVLISIFARSGQAIKKTALVYDAMHEVMNDETQVGSVLILCTHNSGKNLKTYTPMYASCLHEDYIHPFRSIKSDYQKLPIDKTYCQMVSRLIDQKDIVVEETELEKGSLLKSLYDAERIAKSRYFYLRETRKYFFFIVFRTDNVHKDLYDSNTDLDLRICVSKIKQLLN